jgi:hypothetical protein
MSLTKASYAMIEGSAIDVKSYGAVGDGVADDTLAVQAAIDAAIASNPVRSVLVNGLCRITAPLKIDRLIDTSIDNIWFLVFSNTGGGFYVDSAITILDTNFNYSLGPKTSQIMFQNLIFEADSATTAAYVMSAGYLRTAFSGCSFQKIKFFAGTVAPQWSQSIYLDKCVARSWQGTWFENLTETYDLKVSQTMIEASSIALGTLGSPAFNIGTANGCAFTDSVIEGLYGFAIKYKGANGLQISGNYFEGNYGPEIDGTDSDAAHFAFGVNVCGNHFENITITKPWCIGWSGYTYGGSSTGNGATGGIACTLHGLPNPGSEGLVSIYNDGASAGTILADNQPKQFLVDRQYPSKAGYLYGKSFDGDAASLYLGTYYSAGAMVDGIEVSHLDQINLNAVDYKPSYLNLKADGVSRGGINIKNVNVSNSTPYIAFVNSSNLTAGSITQTGATTVNYGTSSDYRLKENVVSIAGATERLKQLKPSRFNFIADADKTVDGFLAHEVADVVPEAITGEKDEVDAEGNPKYQGIDQSKLVPLLVATIQELEARIAALES